MKRTLISVLAAGILTTVLLASSASATEVGYGRKFGLGLELGDPTGLTGKLWVGPTNALDFGLGFWGYGWDDRCAPNGYCPGYWGYRSGVRVWIDGAWLLPPYAGWVWIAGHWAWNGYTWVWQDGYWGPPY